MEIRIEFNTITITITCDPIAVADTLIAAGSTIETLCKCGYGKPTITIDSKPLKENAKG